jgi:hypothetical protein
MEVVAGAEDSMRHVRALQTEVSCIPLYEKMPDMLETIQTLRSIGFRLAGLFPVSRMQDLSVIEFDAVFVKSRHGSGRRCTEPC